MKLFKIYKNKIEDLPIFSILIDLKETKNDFLDKEKEKKFLDGITEKYGQGTLNPETGEFTPNKS